MDLDAFFAPNMPRFRSSFHAGVFDRTVRQWPVIPDLLAWLRTVKLRGRAATWQASAERILVAMTYGEFGAVLNTQDNRHVEQLLDHNVVLEMDGLSSSSDRAMFSEALMTAAICADEIRAIVQVELDSHTAADRGRSQDAKHRNPSPQRPLVDSSTLSVSWAGKTCPLRRTILFRLAKLLPGEGLPLLA